MAFSKAKILRFNEIKSCAPPPGAYNPKYDELMLKTPKQTKEKIIELPSPASSCTDVKSVRSCINLTNFRTPNIPCRKKLMLFNSAGKKSSSQKLIHSQNSEELREKIVECKNKDETIKELETQIEELKLKNDNLKKENEQLTTEKEKTVEKMEEYKVQNKNMLEDINFMKKEVNQKNQSNYCTKLHLENKLSEKTKECEILETKLNQCQEEINNLKINHSNAIETIDFERYETRHEVRYNLLNEDTNDCLNVCKKEIKCKINKFNDSLETEIIDNQENNNNSHIRKLTSYLKNTEDQLEMKKKHCENLENELKKIKKQYNISLQTQADLQQKYAESIDIIKREYQTEIEDIEYELLKEMTDAQRVLSQVKTKYENKIKILSSQTDAQIRQSEENCTEKIKLAEIQMDENCKVLNRNWELRLQEQEMKSAEILKECQAIAEFNIIQCEVEKNAVKLNLQEKEELLAKILLEMTELKSNMSKIIIELNDTRANFSSEIKYREKILEKALADKYCYEITLNKTYNTVDALKKRLLNSDRDVEQLKIELENLETSKLEIESKYLQLIDEKHNIMKINEHLKSDNILLKEIQDKVIVLERELLEKVDNIKLKYDLEILNLNKILTVKQNSLDELNIYIKNQNKLQCEMGAVITDAQNEIERQEAELTEYKFKISCLESLLDSTNEKYLAQGKLLTEKMTYLNDLENKITRKDEEIEEITNMYTAYVEQNGQIKDLQKKYELLNQKSIKLEKNISEQKSIISPYRKQALNSKKNGLLENKCEGDVISLHQNNATEKLKEQKSRTIPPADKENICSPVRSHTFNSFISSPASPLKERNN